MNVSGTTDLAPLDQQAAMLKELFPDAKNVGILYCSAEATQSISAIQSLLISRMQAILKNHIHLQIQTMLPQLQRLPVFLPSSS